MPTVKVENGNFEEALALFQKKSIQEGILKKTRNRMDGGNIQTKQKGKPKSNT